MESNDIRSLLLSTAGLGLRLLQILIALGFLAIIASGIRIINPNEVALVTRFGRLVGSARADQIHEPGLLFSFPYPIDEVIRVPIRQVRELVIDELWFPAGGGLGYPAAADEFDIDFENMDDERDLPLSITGASIDPVREGYCLTGDTYIVQPYAVIKYRILDPVDYALLTVESEELMRTVVVQQLTHAMGESAVDEILTIGKRELAQKTLVRSQDLLDDLSSGIELLAVEFKEIIPPRHVIRDFQRVVSAAIQSQTMIREAEAYRARELPRAQSDARSMILSARADSLRTVANASVRMTKFKTYLPEYGHRSVALESRLLRETLEELLNGIKKLYLIPASEKREGPQIRLLLPKDRS